MLLLSVEVLTEAGNIFTGYLSPIAAIVIAISGTSIMHLVEF